MGQRRRGKLRPGVILQSWWPMFFCIDVLFRIQMPASPRHRARCNRHEARAGMVALIYRVVSCGSAVLLSEIVSLPACAAKYSPLCRFSEPLGPAGFQCYKRDRSNVLFFAVHNGAAVPNPEPVRFIFVRPRELGPRTSHFRVDRKRYHLRSYHLPRSCCNCAVARLASRTRGAQLLQSSGPRLASMLRCRLACVLPPSSLDPRLASGAFAVAKDENRDRFVGQAPIEQP